MEVNQKAPVVSRRHVHIAAPLERVWTLLIDIDCWPLWNSAISKVKLGGAPAAGSIFRWKSGGVTVVSRLQDVEPMRRLSWTGRTAGIDAIHVWELEKEDGGILVRTAESWNGPLAHILRPVLQRFLDRSLEAGLHSFKAAAERGAR